MRKFLPYVSSGNQSLLKPLTATASASAMAPQSVQPIPERLICSLYESGKMDISVGICIMNIHTGEIILSTIFDTQTYVRTIHKLHIYEPNEIVIPNCYLHPVPNKLATLLQSNISPGVKIIDIEKKRFNESAAKEALQRICLDKVVSGNISNVLKDHPLALRALAGAIHHISFVSGPYMEKFRVKFEPSESVMFIDSSTAKSLQLIHNANDINGISLFKFMDHTMTKMGQRTLRSSILQPLSDKNSINERLEATNELFKNEELLGDVRSQLMQCQDLDKLFALMLVSKTQNSFISIHNQDRRLNHIILVKQALIVASNIGKHLQNVNSSLLKQVQEICSNESLEQLMELINDSINEDCVWAKGSLDLKNQKCYAVKAGRNGLLDVSRQVYKVVVDEVLSIVDALAEEHQLQLEQGYNSKRGFYIKILNYKNLDSIPDVFINRTEKKTFLECTVLDIMKCNARIDDTVNEILVISNQMVEALIDEISNFLPFLFMIAEALSLLDLIQSFAHLSIKSKSYVCPEFSEDQINLKSSRHPILETLIRNYIPNDVYSNKEISRFQVITGTNMSGKSVYLRQVAFLSIMAQMGCFIPAQCGIFKIFESLRARICVDGGIISNVSSFTNEMSEMSCILEDINEKSLVIIDELGRGSSINDGFAISLAIGEHLVTTGATIFLTTHFHKLSYVLGTKDGVIQNHMQTHLDKGLSDEDDSDGIMINMDYKIVKGVVESKSYGLNIADRFFDKQIIYRAREISDALEFPFSTKLSDAEIQKAKKFQSLVNVLQYIRDHEDQISQDLMLRIQNEFVL